MIVCTEFIDRRTPAGIRVWQPVSYIPYLINAAESPRRS